MKHIITAMVASLTITSQAASFTWSAGSVVQFDGTTLAGNAISASDLYTVDYTGTGSITPADDVQSKATSTGRTAGRISSVTYKDTETGTDGHHVYTGAKFGMYIAYNDGEKTWYNFSDTIVSITTDATGAYVGDPTEFSFNFGSKTEITSPSQSVSAGSGWYSIQVPEPSTAMLALAGLALLIKRRRA